ncbi:RNA polymerase II C-terminal domain phosphatase-like 4 isoform X1 [Impatiens glandulifera]|uniref:RNA polymerase II C-terminal domain phosphatase-like 4 isoform X1 n=2 Tax=Impatiens glandulifera TaxID=253017 RepID=UPI001FB13217|nr:RNA polymerase II C-terminal domain phosphatase-like 4 isoform X1 [Impatiens glandulifera]
MGVATDSPVNSFSSDDFAALLDAELDTASDTSPDREDSDADEDKLSSESISVKRRKMEASVDVEEIGTSSSYQMTENSSVSVKTDICTHPGVFGGMCIACGQRVDVEEGHVSLRYIHKALTFKDDEITRVRNRDLKNLFRQKKLYLVLDLDHTLLNSTRFMDVISEEQYLMGQIDSLQDIPKGSLFRLDSMHMLTKLRPFIRTFLEELSPLFEMYIYTMGERAYALQMASLLDPTKTYFGTRVIANDDCTLKHQKGLDVVVGQESATLILDDTEVVWGKHKENLILMERYHFFASSCRQFGYSSKSLSQQRSDESETDGALASVLKVLKRIHGLFFAEETEVGSSEIIPLDSKDVRQVLKTVRTEVLKGCKVVFSRVFPNNVIAENQHLWKMAEKLGAVCSTEIDSSVTHLVATDAGTEKSHWAIKEKKFVVTPQWIEAANYFWFRPPEENFPVNQNK